MATKVTPKPKTVRPASWVMDEAIELAIKGNSPYPSQALFLNSDTPNLAQRIAEAFDEHVPIILVWPDGSSRVLQPSGQIPAPARSAALSSSGSGIDLPAA